MKKTLLFFSELNNSDLEWIAEKGKKEAIAADRILIREGQSIDALYIVISGSFSVTIETTGQILAHISEGEILGEVSFIDTRFPLATVKATSESVVLSVARLQLLAKLKQDNGFAARFYRGISFCLSDRMRTTVTRFAYGRELDEIESGEEFSSQIMQSEFELAEAKFEWLINSSRYR